MNRWTVSLRTAGSFVAVIAIASITAPACGGKSGDDSKPAATAQKMHPEAQQKWVSLCVNCHAEDGSGTGEGSKTLNPKPRDFRSAKWQKSVTDAHIKNVIVKGGLAVKMSKDMPGNPDLVAKPMVLKSLIQKIRSFEGMP